VAGRVPNSLGQVVWRVSIEDDASQADGRAFARTARQQQRFGNDSEERLSVHPIISGNRLLYCDRNRIYALDLTRGKSAIAGREDGVLYAPEREPSQAAFQPGRGRFGVPRYTLTACNLAVFARTGSPLTNRAENSRLAGDEGLIGLEIAGGRLQLKVEPPSERWAFEGAPLVDVDRVLVAMRQHDVRPRAVVACFDRTSGHLLWQTFVAAGDTPARPGWEEVSHNLLTLAGDTIYYNTNLGVIASLGIRDGRIHWLKRYDRAGEGDLAQLPAHFDRDLTPCVYHHGVIYCAPSDTPYIFALDAVTGETLWASRVADAVVHLLGVSENRLIASGDRLWWFDAVNGDVVARWPEGPGAGLHGFGRGLIASGAVLWPTQEQRIFVFDVHRATQRQEAIDLRPLGVTAGNLLVAGSYLVIAGDEEIVALGPRPVEDRHESKEAEVALLK
jgi:outer membrane protein assembly factor BamB